MLRHRGAPFFLWGSSIWELNAFTTGNPFLGTKLLGFSVGRGSGAVKGLSNLPKPIWGKLKLLLPEKKSHGLGTRRKPRKKMTYFLRFRVEEPPSFSHSETIFAKKRYTSIVARVMCQIQ